MLNRLFQQSAHWFTKLYHGVTNSIAFYPTLIAVTLFLLALLTLYIDEQSPDLLFGYEIGIKNILYPASARTLLGAIAGGMISLMVFSFSMVMVVLNQAASNYSPRLLPNLVGQRPHQVTMGFYIGTIAYTFVVLTSIQSKIYAFGVPSLSIITSSLLSLLCLALFVAFINTVSQSIQIGNIINHVYQDTLHALQREAQDTHVPSHNLPDTQDWTTVFSPRSGYLDEINNFFFLRITRRHKVTIRMCVPNGQFINRRDPLFLVSRPLSEEEQQEVIGAMVFRHQEEIGLQYAYGFKHLTEIALKGLSPGINDPGTAIQAIDRLTDLFVERLAMRGYKILTDKDHQLRLIYESIRYDDLLYLCFTSIGEYAKGDLTVTLKLLTLLQTVLRNDTDHRHTDAVMNLLHDLTKEFEQDFNKHTDREVLTKKVSSIIKEGPDHPLDAPVQSHLAELCAADAV